MKPMEYRRYFPITDLRASASDGAMQIGGYAAVFDSPSLPIGGMFREIVRRGAFTKTLQESDVLGVWNHDTNIVLARRSNNSLTLQEDEHGLRFEMRLPNTTQARDAHELVQGGFVKEMSFGFSVVKDRWTRDLENPTETRELLEVALFEISPVAFPAYPATEVEARSVLERCAQLRTTSEPGTNANHSEAGPDWRIDLMKRQLELMELPK